MNYLDEILNCPESDYRDTLETIILNNSNMFCYPDAVLVRDFIMDLKKGLYTPWINKIGGDCHETAEYILRVCHSSGLNHFDTQVLKEYKEDLDNWHMSETDRELSHRALDAWIDIYSRPRPKSSSDLVRDYAEIAQQIQDMPRAQWVGINERPWHEGELRAEEAA